MTSFEVQAERTHWQGRVIRAGAETYRYADGAQRTFDKVWHPGAAAILAVEERHVWLVRQPREAARIERSLEIPAGKRDRPGESLLELARRELVEEVGRQAASWRELASFYSSAGFCDERITLFLATDLRAAPGGAAPEADEHIEILRWPLADLDRAIAETQDAKTLIALLWLTAQRRAPTGRRSASGQVE